MASEVLKRFKSEKSEAAAPSLASLCAILSFLDANNRNGDDHLRYLAHELQQDLHSISIQVSESTVYEACIADACGALPRASYVEHYTSASIWHQAMALFCSCG